MVIMSADALFFLQCFLCAQVSEAFGLPYAGTALKEAAAKWPVLAGMGKCDGEMCQVRFADPQPKQRWSSPP
jgi:hypothetical protein